MNAFFGLLHNGCSELEVFMVDVVVFAIAAVTIYALVFLARYKILKFVERAKDGPYSPQYLSKTDTLMWDDANTTKKGGKKKKK